MFGYWSMGRDPDGIAGTLRLRSDPRNSSRVFGIITDTDGARWYLAGQADEFLLARPADDMHAFGHASSPTSSMPDPIVRYRSYRVEIVDDER